VIRTQAPLIRSINDDAGTWRAMWRTQVRQGMIPYYMFVERDTGPQDYFAVPLARGYDIFRDAYQGVPVWAGRSAARRCRPPRARYAWTG
jgi:L-lysine 2,3-aminomutase